jgi:hypothetical protein
MSLSPQWRRALEMLANAGLSGVTDVELMSRGFSAEMMESLVLSGRVASAFEVQKAGGHPIKVVIMRITDVGRREIKGSNQPQ